ncbi:MAG: glycosyltransferase family 4 protein [Symbiobacteriia bacterium]
MKILVDARWKGQHGIGRFASEVLKRFPAHDSLEGGLPLLHPLDPLWLSLMIRHSKPAVFFSPGFNPPWRSSTPFFFTIHDLIHLRFPGEGGNVKELYYKTVVLPAVGKARKVLTVSEFSKQEIIDWSGIPAERVSVVGGGVGGEFTPAGDSYSPGFPYLLYVGNRKPHKNIARMLRGFALSGTWPHVKLLLTGKPDAETMSLASALGIQEHIVFLGPVSDALLPVVYRGAVALLFTSLYEGFGLPAIEAMACGTPVVTSKVASLGEVVGEVGVFVDPLEVESIAVGIRRAIEDGHLRDTLRSQGVERVRRYSWERTAEKVIAVVANV